MANFRIDLEYDGTDFRGWQVQPGERTVQGELETAVEQILGEALRVEGAGRTDAGVHALGQVACFRSETSFDSNRLQQALNAHLPDDVRVVRTRVVPEYFSARRSAISRRYRYQMLRVTSPVRRRYYHELTQDVDPGPMAEAATHYRGEHDFTAFAASTSPGNRICTILDVGLRSTEDVICLHITANRFLHHMVRRLAGALFEVGRGKLVPEEVRQILADRDRSRGGPRLPACGLFLVEVLYPPELESGGLVDDGPAPL